MLESRPVGLTPAYLRFAFGYACTVVWAVMLLFSPVFDPNAAVHATSPSMLPGLVACLSSIVFFRSFPSISGRTPFVIVAGIGVAVGTLLCTYPALASMTFLRIAGLVISGFFAIIIVMSWFDAFAAKLTPRGIIVLAGCAVSIAAFACWGMLSCPAALASLLMSALPLVSLALLPKASSEQPAPAPQQSLGKTISQAVPARTLIGLAVTFFIVRSIGTLAPSFDTFSRAVAPASLLVPLAITAFFVASAMLVKKRIDPSILYKILLSCFAGVVFLLASSTGVTSSLVFYSSILAEVMMWTTLTLWAKKTPVRPQFVFAMGWCAECLGNTLGQTLTPLLVGQGPAYLAVAIILIMLAVGFAFSEGQLMLDVDFEAEDRPTCTQAPTDEAAETDARAAHDSADEAQAPSPAGNEAAAAPDDATQHEDEAPGAADSAPDPMDAFVAAYDISPREREVLALWIAGRGMKYIQNTLYISESTVKSHLRSIYRKCDTHNRDETISLFEHETGGAHKEAR